MKVIGIRCSNTDFVYSLLEGNKKLPKVIKSLKIAFPKNFSDGERLFWFQQELNTIISEHKPDIIVIKGPEPLVRRSNSLDSRLHNEAIIFLAAHLHGVSTLKKTKGTIAKDLGLKGRGKYLNTKLDTSPINNFDSFNDKEQDAILSAWSSMS